MIETFVLPGEESFCFGINITVPGYYELLKKTTDGSMYRHNGLAVICSGEVKEDGKRWLHISISRSSRVPSYDDLCRVKRDFIGEESKAVMVFAPKSKHVNIHPYCLHLWSCLDEDPLPEFSGLINGVRTI